MESITKEMQLEIETLGLMVADEVRKFVEARLIKFRVINFMGFSLGGVIARAALQHLL